MKPTPYIKVCARARVARLYSIPSPTLRHGRVTTRHDALLRVIARRHREAPSLMLRTLVESACAESTGVLLCRQEVSMGGKVQGWRPSVLVGDAQRELAERLSRVGVAPAPLAAVLAEAVRRGLAEMAREAGVQVKP
jgi:hypothetical protein